MEIASKYDPSKIENKWYKYWMDNGFFKSTPDEREPYTIVIPPPNVTGVLHMGHMLNNTLQDVLVRRARMMGKNACWVPGTDHASIATEAKVVGKLRNEGIKKSDLTRDEFMKHAWDWTHKHGGIILEQLKKLGASCDWDRTRFTMDEAYYDDVIDVFIDLFNKGKIYRGSRMVNWDCIAKTAVSDEEVFYRELQSKLYYITYHFENQKEGVTIATTRPETILGDSAICVNPNDDRFKHLIGKKVIVPIANRAIPIIADEYVDMEFGTGCLKITPAHDPNDYEIGKRHNLEFIEIFNDNGTLNAKGLHYEGRDRLDVRDAIVEELKTYNNIVKIEDYINKVGFSERTDAVIEPKLSKQWFVSMKELAEPALQNVMNDTIQLVPEKFKNTYRHWMENVKDWCISRQLWWGHRIPVYYINDSDECVAAKSLEEALVLAQKITGNKNLTIQDLTQDEDVVDTWFSSWLWPISVFHGLKEPNNKDISYYYPTNDLVTAPEILFFWVARMVIAGYEYKGDKPFRNVYLTGIVRDKLHRKMSKSLGNSPDPLDLIEKYSADGIRIGMLFCSPAGNDLLFDESLPEQGRNFTNKIWNAFRLVQSWNIDDTIPQPESAKQAIQWFDARIAKTIEDLDNSFNQFRISESLMIVYKLFWDDFSAWYLEAIKPAYQQPIDRATYESTIVVFEKLLKLLHPFMPFITEEIWQIIETRQSGESIMISQMPKNNGYQANTLKNFEYAQEIITKVRAVRANNQISPREKLKMYVLKSSLYNHSLDALMMKLENLESIEITETKIEGAVSFLVGTIEYYIPINKEINVEEEINKINEEIAYFKGLLNIVTQKLSNESFANNAPAAIVDKERQKKADAETKIKTLKERIVSLKK